MKGAADRPDIHDLPAAPANERFLTQVVRFLPVATVVADYADRIIFFNDQFIRLTGYTTEDLPTLSAAWPKAFPDERYCAEVMQSWTEAVRNVLVEGGEFAPQRYRITRKDGVMRELEFRYQPLGGHYIIMAEDVTERKQAEAALRESEANFRTLVTHSPIALAMADENENLVLLSERFVNTFGYTPADLPSVEAWWPLAYPDEAYRHRVRTDWEVSMEEARATGRDMDPREWRVACKDGSVRDVEFRVTFLNHHVIFALTDITERKRAEAALQQSESLFRTLTESTQAAILMFQEGRFIYGNPAAESVTGYSVEEMPGVSLWNVLHPDSLADIEARLLARSRGEPVPSHQEIRFTAKHGEDRWVDYSVGFAELNGRQTDVMTAFDITERKQAESALRLSEERFSRAFHESGTALAISSLHGRRLIEANAAWLNLFGFKRNQVIGYTPEELGISFTQPSSLIRTLMEGQAVRNVELSVHIGMERELITLTSGAPISINDQPCVLWGHQDITALKHTEAELRASREQLRHLAARLQTIREENRASVAREIHDELGQALTSLKLELRWLDGLLEDAQPAVRGKLASMLDLVGATINNVRRIATWLRPGILDDFGLIAALEWQAQEFATHAGIPCRLVNETGDEDDLPLDRDRATAVFRIFQESLTNVARHAAAKSVTARLTRTGETLILEVRDDGRGITAAELTNARSLGLLGMRERAQMFGGTFDIHGEPGEGTTVTVRMPLEAVHEGIDSLRH